jgi:riboflavin biosynthesis pyrimidine reductase
MRQLLPTPIDEVTLDHLAEMYAYPPGGAVRANMVSTLDGAVTVDGRSDPISGPPDKYMFGFLRALADVVVVGAGTARAEGYGPGRSRAEFAHLRESAEQFDAPVMAVVTRTGELDPTSDLFTKARNRSIVVTCSAAKADQLQALREVADVIVTGDETVDLVTGMSQLADRGLSRILCEGGPHLLGDLTAAGRLDELAWAISPQLAGGASHRIMVTNSIVQQSMQLHSLHEDGGFLFSHYVRGE